MGESACGDPSGGEECGRHSDQLAMTQPINGIIEGRRSLDICLYLVLCMIELGPRTSVSSVIDLRSSTAKHRPSVDSILIPTKPSRDTNPKDRRTLPDWDCGQQRRYCPEPAPGPHGRR